MLDSRARFCLIPITFLLFLISSPIFSHCILNITYAEQHTDGFLIDVGDEDVSIAWIESSGVETFRVIVQKNGGISGIIIALMTYTGTAGWFIWTEDWAQTTGSNATSEPTIQDMGDYVVLTCFGKYA
ncbi:MAG: hypothetical protein ACETWE_04370, partial [Candidatus Bathyarchaeia archaeon]